MDIELDGRAVVTEQDFHRLLATALGVQDFYGYNLDALWDLLSSGVERPLTLKWKNCSLSRCSMGNSFNEILGVLERVRLQDESFGWSEKFLYALEEQSGTDHD
tara:strand:- start:1570 stop:1881 length:312 start_codon:yes stop_codon:yes gene_type:complete